MTLVVKGIERSGPCGLPVIAVTQYSDFVRIPEMLFELGLAGGPHLNPFYFRNDHIGVEQWSRDIIGDQYVYCPKLHQEHECFSKVWDKNLNAQRFYEAFERKQRT